MASITRPTLTELISRTQTDLEARLLDGDTALRRSVLSVLARMSAGQAHLMYGYLEWLAKQSFVDTADAEYLDRLADIWGKSRKAAVAATGSVTFAGSNGVIIPAGTELSRVDGALYTTDVDATVASGAASASVTASAAGEKGNTDAGVALTLSAPISSLTSTAMVGGAGLTGGTDEEADDDLRGRVLARIQAPPQGGCAADYEAWALEVAGVTRAWVYPSHMGAGTVGVAIVADDADDGPLPSAALVATVQAYIEGLRPVTAEVYVFAPAALVVDVSLSVTPSTTAVRAAVKAELTDLFAREAEPGGTILISHLREAVSVATGETDSSFTSPTADVVASGTAFPVLGAVTFA